jgi:hypothetical protein
MTSRKPKSPPAKATSATEQHSPENGPFEVKPVRGNLPLLVISTVLLVVWLAYLIYVAWRTVA